MNEIFKPSLHTKRYHQITTDDLEDIDLFVIAESPSENRDRIPVWEEIEENKPSSILKIKFIDNDSASFKLHLQKEELIYLRDDEKILNFFKNKKILIDISGMRNHVWASLMRVIVKNSINTKILYAEPEKYKQHPSPASANKFDLSISLGGLSPLPGFARLSGPENESKSLLIILLGFEGNRSQRVAMQLDPTPDVVPIVGVPGFQLEFPTYTIACNADLLNNFNSHANIRYARASCPFDTFNTIKEIRKDYPEHYLYIAPVGTKPHSLGAIWYATKFPSHTEVMFDFPVRKAGKTSGIGMIHIYDFGEF